MRTIWKGAISFGLIHIPIKLYPATEKKDIKFNYLHERCKTPVKYEKHCPVCQTDVPSEEIVKGYEYEKGKYVIIQDEDLENLPLESTKTISIINFVNLSEVDPVYYEKSYYLAPGDGGQKPFELLRQAMENTAKAAIAKVTIRTKESLAAIRVYGKNIMMETMYYPEEIRSSEGIAEMNYSVTINENELRMAENLINSLTEEFRPESYHNRYREALMDVIQSKIAGEKIEIPQHPQVEKAVDLMEALRASIQMAQKDRAAAQGRTVKNSTEENSDTQNANGPVDSEDITSEGITNQSKAAAKTKKAAARKKANAKGDDEKDKLTARKKESAGVRTSDDLEGSVEKDSSKAKPAAKSKKAAKEKEMIEV